MRLQYVPKNYTQVTYSFFQDSILPKFSHQDRHCSDRVVTFCSIIKKGIVLTGPCKRYAVARTRRPALGYWVKEGVGLVVHFSLEDVAKINTPWPWPWPWCRSARSQTACLCRMRLLFLGTDVHWGQNTRHRLFKYHSIVAREVVTVKMKASGCQRASWFCRDLRLINYGRKLWSYNKYPVTVTVTVIVSVTVSKWVISRLDNRDHDSGMLGERGLFNDSPSECQRLLNKYPVTMTVTVTFWSSEQQDSEQHEHWCNQGNLSAVWAWYFMIAEPPTPRQNLWQRTDPVKVWNTTPSLSPWKPLYFSYFCHCRC